MKHLDAVLKIFPLNDWNAYRYLKNKASTYLSSVFRTDTTFFETMLLVNSWSWEPVPKQSVRVGTQTEIYARDKV